MILRNLKGWYAVINMDDASQMRAIAEPFFFSWLQREIDFIPVISLEDLVKAGASIKAANKKFES